MTIGKFGKLKSGTDVRGIAAGDNITLTDEAVIAISKAFYIWLCKKYDKYHFKIAVGNDSRVSAAHISSLTTGALLSCGADVVYTGLSSTPSMFVLLHESDFLCDASVMITASHLPADRNGLKFFTPEGGLSGEDIDEILEIAESGKFAKGQGVYSKRSFMDGYSHILVEKVENACGKLPLKGKKIIVDAGNGAGGFFAEKVLKPLGANIEGSLFLEPDGNFPNHIPNPEDRAAIECLSAAVKATGADLGVIFDTDVDRAACVDAGGEEINRDRLIALLSAMILPEKGGVIVTDSVTSTHLTDFIEALGGKHLRFKRGYKNVISKCRELNESGVYSPLAIETSGHAAFPENYYLDDGAYVITKILISLADLGKNNKKLSSLIDGLKKPKETAELRLGFTKMSKDFKKEGARVIEELKKVASSSSDMHLSDDNFEGVRILFDGRWVLVRMSVHDPVMPVNFESDFEGGNKATAEMLYEQLKNYSFLDTTKLTEFISK